MKTLQKGVLVSVKPIQVKRRYTRLTTRKTRSESKIVESPERKVILV